MVGRVTPVTRPLFAISLSLFTGLLALQLHGSTREIASDRSPVGRIISLPDFWGANAIWGATGNDRRGHIWLGITSNDEKTGSAHLFEFDPATDVVVDRGNVVAELERLHLRRAGERQMKIHSRIVEMPDGYLYFASMDESGEKSNGTKLPDWGGHLWRLAPTGRWEHLAKTPEALIAVAAGGPFVYALGYFEHVLYQFNTRTKAVGSIRVGSVDGHISRNFFADERGHVFVPRLTRPTGNAQRTDVSLVEFGPDLREVASFPLSDYLEARPEEAHGIVAIHPDGGAGWYFATGKGRLYRVGRAATGSSTMTDLGWYHPSGPRYIATMFRDQKTGTLYGAGEVPGTRSRFEWIARDAAGHTTISPLPIGDKAQFPGPTLAYGSMTRDAQGRFYVVGTTAYKPIMLQITPQ